MPWNPDGTRKRSSLYKKSSAFKLKNPYPPNRKGKLNPNSEGNTDLPDGRSRSAKDQ